MRRSLSVQAILLTATALGLAAGAPANSGPWGQNKVSFPEQLVCVEDQEERKLGSKIPCYFIPHDDPVLRQITENTSYYRYQKDKYNIWSIVLQIIGVLWIVSNLLKLKRPSRYIP